MRANGEWLSASQEERPHQRPSLAPRSWTSDLQNQENVSVCCLSHPSVAFFMGLSRLMYSTLFKVNFSHTSKRYFHSPRKKKLSTKESSANTSHLGSVDQALANDGPRVQSGSVFETVCCWHRAHSFISGLWLRGTPGRGCLAVAQNGRPEMLVPGLRAGQYGQTWRQTTSGGSPVASFVYIF